MTAIWTVERTGNHRFPYRIAIEQGGQLLVAVRTQARWPGPGQQIFCLREHDLDPAEPLEVLERVPLAHLTRVGRKLALVLDRPNRKRCELLTVQKPRADGTGFYEQIFFRTESGIRAHRSRSRVELTASAEGPIAVVIDSAERYPWRFPEAAVTRRKLAAGDYALLTGERVRAVVERKSFDNLVTDAGAVQALHHQLADLASHDAAALVIEADYRDFLDPTRLKGRWPPAYLARVLAEISAMHPRLPVIYAGNRTLANAWTLRFFHAVASGQTERAELELPLSIERRYDAEPRGPGIITAVRETALITLTEPFALAELAARFPDLASAQIRRILDQLRREGKLVLTSRGRGARWAKVGG